MPADPDELAALKQRLLELERENTRLEDQCRVNELYRAAIEHAPLGLGIADGDGDMLAWNDAMLGVSGYRPDQVALWREARDSEGARAMRSRMLEVVRERGGLQSHAIPIIGHDGVSRDVVTSAVCIEIDGAPRLHITMQDMSELNRVGAELRETEGRFNQVVAALRQVIYLTAGDRPHHSVREPGVARALGSRPTADVRRPIRLAQGAAP